MKCCLAICLSLLIAFNASASPKSQQSNGSNSTKLGHGSIKENSNTDTFGTLQDSTIEYFKHLNDAVRLAAKGTVPAPIPTPDVNHFTYLNAAYLYCSVQNGVCPTVLDALLEVDVINSRLAKQAQCPALSGFWTQWVKTDMEARSQYQVKTGFLAETQDFRQKDRPKYIKCQATVQTEMSDPIAASLSDSDYFTRRYSGDSQHTKSVATMVELLTELKAKVPNVIDEAGTH